MSLVNQMLQDLQARKAADSKPLVGLRAVPVGQGPATAAPGPRWIVTAMAVTAVVIVITLMPRIEAAYEGRMQQVSHSGGDALPVPDPVTTDSGAAIQSGSRAAGPVLYSLATNRLDYRLRTRPEPLPARVATVAPEPAVELAGETVAQELSLDVVDDGPASAFRKTIDPKQKLRREGLAALRAGQAVAAEQHFAQLTQFDPADPEPYLMLHAALQAQSRHGDANAALMRGLETSSAPSKLAKALAHALLSEGLVDDALIVLTQHRPAGAVDLQYDASLAAINQRAGNHVAAAALYRTLVAVQPANGDWWVGLAISQDAQGLSAEATQSYAAAADAGTLDLRLARYAAQRLRELEKGS